MFSSFWQGWGSDGQLDEDSNLDKLVGAAIERQAESFAEWKQAGYSEDGYRQQIWISQDFHKSSRDKNHSLGGWVTHKWRYICIIKHDGVEWITDREEAQALESTPEHHWNRR